MSQLRCVTIVGDSNIQRHMSTNNCRDRPLMSGAQIIQCGRASLLAAALQSVRAESNVCVLSCVTNFLTGTSGSSTISLRVEPVLIDFLTKIASVAESRPEVQFLICPPMYRLVPIWFREALPEILQKFSDLMKKGPPNCHLMPSFPTPNYEDDGVHLTAYSGFEFVLHLFDSMASVLDSLDLPPETRSVIVSEASRVLEDRVMVLEQDHRRLNRRFEFKSAVDSELSDFQENIRNESFLMIKGLGRLPKLEPKEWQKRAQADVQGVFLILMGREYPIQYIQNSTSRAKDAETQYRVKLPSAEMSREIRDKFGSFFLSGGPTRPPSLKAISIRNCVTAATLARIVILQLLAKRYLAANPGSQVKVIGYDPRPLLKLTPPPSKDKSFQRVLSYNYIEAISALPVNFSGSEIEDVLKRISPKLHGNLKPIFVVISDDMIKRKKTFQKSKPAAAQAAVNVSGSESTESSKSPGGAVKSGRGPKRGPDPSPSGSGSTAKKGK